MWDLTQANRSKEENWIIYKIISFLLFKNPKCINFQIKDLLKAIFWSK